MITDRQHMSCQTYSVSSQIGNETLSLKHFKMFATVYIFVLDYKIYMKVLLYVNKGRQNQNMRPKAMQKV